jgi:hypothetical protein
MLSKLKLIDKYNMSGGIGPSIEERSALVDDLGAVPKCPYRRVQKH